MSQSVYTQVGDALHDIGAVHELSVCPVQSLTTTLLPSLSSSLYTLQLSDVERECDGFFNFDRTNKFNASDVAAIVAANQAILAAARAHA
jgi:hypothetical protein